MSHENKYREEGETTIPPKYNAVDFQRRVSGFEPDPAHISLIESNSNMVVLTRDATSSYCTQVCLNPFLTLSKVGNYNFITRKIPNN